MSPGLPPDSVTPLISDSQRGILIAAAGGSILSLLFMGEPFSWRTASTAIGSGLFAAYYGVELVAQMFHMGPGSYGALGAAFGFGSMTALGGLFKLLRKWRDDPDGFVRSWLPFFRRRDGE